MYVYLFILKEENKSLDIEYNKPLIFFFILFLLLYIIVLKDNTPKLLTIKLKAFQLNFFLKKFIKLHKKLVESSLLNIV
jgi:hypothetical protein